MDLASTEKSFVVMVAAATFVAFWAIWVAVTWEPPIEARLRALRTRRMKTRNEQRATKPSPKATSLGFMRDIADRLNLLRGTAADQTTRKLRRAGFLSRDASVVYVFIKLALPLALGFLMILATSSGLVSVSEDMILPLCVGGVLSGFMMPEVYIKNVTSRRREVLNYVLPEGLDLLTICVEAGLGFDGAIAKLTEHLEGPIVEEFTLTLNEMRIGESRHDALKKLAERAAAPEVGHFTRAIIQADVLGISLGRILKVQASDTRDRRQAAAEEKAMKAPIKMLFPTVIFIFPAMFLVILGPAMLTINEIF